LVVKVSTDPAVRLVAEGVNVAVVLCAVMVNATGVETLGWKVAEVAGVTPRYLALSVCGPMLRRLVPKEACPAEMVV